MLVHLNKSWSFWCWCVFFIGHFSLWFEMTRTSKAWCSTLKNRRMWHFDTCSLRKHPGLLFREVLLNAYRDWLFSRGLFAAASQKQTKIRPFLETTSPTAKIIDADVHLVVPDRVVCCANTGTYAFMRNSDKYICKSTLQRIADFWNTDSGG